MLNPGSWMRCAVCRETGCLSFAVARSRVGARRSSRGRNAHGSWSGRGGKVVVCLHHLYTRGDSLVSTTL